MFLSKPINVNDFGLIFAGAQKNVGPAGIAIVIIREDLIRTDLDEKIPTYLRYDIHADNGSMYNTPTAGGSMSGQGLQVPQESRRVGSHAPDQHRKSPTFLRLPRQ